MSKVAVTGNASGTGVLTLAAPNTNDNITLTLPSSAGTLATSATVLSQFNATGSAPVYACRAWVNFNGTGTVAIRASGNVSSITDNGTGDYTVNFTTAMPDANYSVAGGLEGDPAYTAMTLVYNFSRTSNTKVAPTTTALRVQSLRASDSVALDNAIIYVAIFR